MGVDYSAELINTATTNASLAGASAKWLLYDFNEDKSDLVCQLVALNVTHVFIYLLPKQLELRTVRSIVTRLWESGVMVCCHKYHPSYLVPTREDKLMELVVYDRSVVVR